MPRIAAASWDWGCADSTGFGQTCSWNLGTGGSAPVETGSTDSYYPDQSVADPDPCTYRVLSPQPEPGSAAWQGNDPAHGRLWQTWCPDALYVEELNPDGTVRQAPTYMGTFYVADGDRPGEGASVDPMALVARAKGNLTIPTPQPHFGPDAAEVAVKIPVWLWIDYNGPISVTTSAGTLTATVTATLESTTWRMGEPADADAPAVPAAPVTCAGPGAPFQVGLDAAKPPCGYTYIWRSLPDRSKGTGRWTVTAEAHWTVAWTVSTGLSGSEPVATTTSVPLQVREWHAILVDKPAG